VTRLVVLTRSAAAVPEGYHVRLGPLAFLTPADTVSETIGDGLDAVGAALVPTDRRPRPLKMKLPVRGWERDVDPPESGRRLRRHVRQVIDNSRWRLGGFYLTWDADPDLDGWVLVGGAEMGEADPGVAFGEFDLDLSDLYFVGRPGTHRPGRRAIIGDRRGGLIPRDTRRLLYSTDFSSQALPAEPLVVPGDVVDLVASGNRPGTSTTAGPLRGARRLWRTSSASDGEIVSYLPDEAVLPGRDRFLALDDLGAVRVWDLDASTTYPPVEAGYTAERDADPDLYYGWERVLGDVLTADHPLAIDNGACRVAWLGSGAAQGLAIEYFDAALGRMSRIGRVLHAAAVREQRVVEATPERAIVEWRAGQYALRAILQRGWWGPRLESYADGGGTTRLEFAPASGAAVTVTPQAPTFVRAITTPGAQPTLLWASGSNDETVDTAPTVIAGTAATWRRTRVLTAQLGPPPGPSADALASLSLVDARPVPVLVGRR
jgi:hypothetical protein